MDLYVPEEIVTNLNEIVINQNRELLKEICLWKGWNYEKTLFEFKQKFSDLNLLDMENKNEIVETRTRKPWICEGKEYLLESISDNVYSKKGEFIGKKFGEYLELDVEED